MVRIIFLAFGVTLCLVVGAVFLFSVPPKIWRSTDYSSAKIEDVRDTFDEVSSEGTFKHGYGWIDRNMAIENHLRLLLGSE